MFMDFSFIFVITVQMFLRLKRKRVKQHVLTQKVKYHEKDMIVFS